LALNITILLLMLFRTCPIFLSRKKLSYCYWRFLMGAPTMCMTRFCPT
jgi:hypothetical protein